MSTTDTATTAHTVTSIDIMDRTTTSHGTGMLSQARLPYQAAQLLKRSTGSSTLTTHTEAPPVRASRHESSRLVVPMHATTTESPPHPVRVRFLQIFCRDRIQTSMSES